jgi:ABC-type dipeptide/oligopeptide/nickel transport system permease component
MLAFIIRRLLQAVLVMLTVALVAFLLFQYVGDPVSQMVGQDATPEDRSRLRVELRLDQPFYVQFAAFVGNAAQGDWRARGLGFVLINLVVDLLYFAVDPRLRIDRAAAAH